MDEWIYRAGPSTLKTTKNAITSMIEPCPNLRHDFTQNTDTLNKTAKIARIISTQTQTPTIH